MARFYLQKLDGEQGGIQTGQDEEYANRLQRPPMFGGGSVELKVGGIAFGLVGHDFYHIGPGEYVDLPDSVPTKVIKSLAPHLLTKAEAVAKGIAAEDGSLVVKAAKKS